MRCYVCPNTASTVDTPAGPAEICDGCGDETRSCLCPGDPAGTCPRCGGPDDHGDECTIDHHGAVRELLGLPADHDEYPWTA